tara:strand:+ start:9676 stop:9867 length:192 start_codon:yes stop_codon:yes gene_type:complete
VGVGDDQLHIAQATAFQAPQELAREHFRLTQHHLDSERFPPDLAVAGHGDHNGNFDDTPGSTC